MPLSQELLSAYLDGRSTAEEGRTIEAQLERDPLLARQLDELRYAVKLLAELPRVPVPRAFTLSEAQVGADAALSRGWQTWLRPLYLRGATALVAICLLVLLVGDLGFRATLRSVTVTPVALSAERGGLAQDDGDPTAISAKVATSEVTAGETPLGMVEFPLGLLAGEVALAALLVMLLVASWQCERAT